MTMATYRNSDEALMERVRRYIAGAWVGVVYSVFVAAFAALVENQAFEKPWKETVPSIIAVVGGAIIGAIGFSICL